MSSNLTSSRPSSTSTPTSSTSALPSTHIEPHYLLSTPSNSLPSTPRYQHTNKINDRQSHTEPILLSTLVSGDQESLLCLCIEEESDFEGRPSEREMESFPATTTTTTSGRTSTSRSGKGRVYAGSQGGSIHVWDLNTLTLRARLTGHTGAVLALEFVAAMKSLISSSGDGTIRIWHTPTLSPLFIIYPPHDNVGDIFSLAYLPHDQIQDDLVHSGEEDDEEEKGRGWKGVIPTTPANGNGGDRKSYSKERSIPEKKRKGAGASLGGGRLFAGCQDTSIQWIDLPSHPLHSPPSTSNPNTPLNSLPSYLSPGSPGSSSPPIHRAPNKFFDTYEKSRAIPILTSGSPGGTTPRNSSSNNLLDLHHGAAGTGSNALGHNAVGGGQALKRSGSRTEPFGTSGRDDGAIELQIEQKNIATFSHYGYVYCMSIGRSHDRPVLISGSGDSTIRLWHPSTSSLSLIATLTPPSSIFPTSSTSKLSSTSSQKPQSTSSSAPAFESEAILSLTYASSTSTLFVGHQTGLITIWDLDTLTCLKLLQPHQFDILSLVNLNGELFAGDSDGGVTRWDKGFGMKERWTVGKGVVLGMCKSREGVGAGGRGRERGGGRLLTAGGDKQMKIWDIPEPPDLTRAQEAAKSDKGFQGELFHLLSRFIRYKSIASIPSYHEECRQTALYLKRVLRSFGASSVQVLPNEIEGKNPFVFGVFQANSSDQVSESPPTTARNDAASQTSGTIPPSYAPSQGRRNRVLFYGHYDVVGADEKKEGWSQDPWELTGKNGWLYGRGVTDNKGPILAIASAASALQLSQSLPVDLVMVLEGEEETGSAGFQEAIRKHRSLIGEIDVILVSNSYWLGEDVPCVTFGLRGVIHASLKVTSNQPDLHSGISGGVVSEPLVDLVRILSYLTSPSGDILIPNFLREVRPLSPEEDSLYASIIARCSHEKLTKGSHTTDPRQSLIDRWRQPSLSIHAITTSSPSKALIPSSAEAKLSIRIVPDQSLQGVIDSLKGYLERSFDGLKTVNQLQIEINHTSTFWLSSPHSPANTLLASCIQRAWGIEPLFIREGGSIPSLPFLESELGADAVHFPMATGEANAHLGDERIRFENLAKGTEIVKDWLTRLGGGTISES